MLFGIIASIAYAFILYYLFKLEKIGCACALDWRRSFIMGFLVLAIIVMFVPLGKNPTKLTIIFVTLFTLLAIGNAIITIQYVNYLKKEKCECSKSEARNVMQIVAIIQLVAGFVALFYLGLAMHYLAKLRNAK